VFVVKTAHAEVHLRNRLILLQTPLYRSKLWSFFWEEKRRTSAKNKRIVFWLFALVLDFRPFPRELSSTGFQPMLWHIERRLSIKIRRFRRWTSAWAAFY